jgi:hypothetical protein
MSHIVKLGSVATVRVQFLTGVAITQTDPRVQTASRGTGATFINPANDPKGFIAFFNGTVSIVSRTWNQCLAARAETTAAGREVCPAGRGR